MNTFNIHSAPTGKERRSAERKHQRQARRQLMKGHKQVAKATGIGLRDSFELSWRTTTNWYVEILRSLLAILDGAFPGFSDETLVGLVERGYPLPFFLPYESFLAELEEVFEPFPEAGPFQIPRMMFENMCGDGYFVKVDLAHDATVRTVVTDLAHKVIKPGHINLDFALFGTERIARLIPVIKGQTSIDDLWAEYLTTDPFGRFGI